MKKRDERSRVVIAMRMRAEDRWVDGTILNISAGGLLLCADDPPGRGACLEVRRGSQVVIGRVIWFDGHCFGVKAQDPIDIDRFVRDRPPAPRPERPEPPAPQRSRSAEEHERSRQVARAMQFAGLAALAAGAGMIAFGSVGRVLAQPIASVQAVLER